MAEEERDICQRCGVDWTGAPGHPRSYCDEMFIRMDHAKLIEERDKLLRQNRQLKESIWKHLHIKHERTICPLSVGTPERCCEIIMKDAGLNPANGEFIEKKCPSTYRQGEFKCEKNEGHVDQRGNVPHQGGGQTWLTI